MLAVLIVTAILYAALRATDAALSKLTDTPRCWREEE
jgi:hypothetical protein